LVLDPSEEMKLEFLLISVTDFGPFGKDAWIKALMRQGLVRREIRSPLQRAVDSGTSRLARSVATDQAKNEIPRFGVDQMRVAEGDRFRVLEDHALTGLSMWRAPFTGAFDCVLPAGLILVASEQQEGATGFGCVPEEYEEGERMLVPEEDRNRPKYAGYYFVLRNAEIGTWFDRVP
jgi:hypothetical protein